MRPHPVADDSDGVRSYLRLAHFYEEGDLTVTRGVTICMDSGHRDEVWLVREGGRTYHHSPWIRQEAVEVVAQAREAWARQDAAQTKESDLIGFLRGNEGVCPLVVRQDSAAAGNCSPGTDAWLRQRGWASCSWIPGIWLIPHLRDERVRRVAVALRSRMQRDLR